jgi:hypothetical protein
MTINNNSFREIIDDILFDLQINFNPVLISYISTVLEKNIIYNEIDQNNLDTSKDNLFKSSEYYLLKFTIFLDDKKNKKINKIICEELYNKIFELYLDEVAYEVCANLNDIEILLDSIKYYKYKDDISELLSKREISNKYLQRRLAKYMFLNIITDSVY